MDIRGIIQGILGAIPVIRKGWHWLIERGLDIEIGDYPIQEISSPKIFSVNRDSRSNVWVIASFFGLKLTNNRTDRLERITKCHLEWKRSRFVLWSKTLAKITIRVGVNNAPWQEIVLQPLGSPVTVPIKTSEVVAIEKIPKKTSLVLVLTLVGPVKRIEHVVTNVLLKSA